MLKRLSLSLMAIAVIAVMVSAATFALFTAETKNEGNTFGAGTVSLTNATGTSFAVTGAVPGDTGGGNFTVSYDGSLNAWLGLSVGLKGELFTCDAAYPPAVTISDGTNTYTLPTVDPAAPSTLSTTAMQLIGAVAPPTDPLDAATFATQTITANWTLPLDMGNDCQTKTGEIVLTFKAVQSASNPNDADGPDWN